MKYKKYRICLLSLLIIAVVGGIFYYNNTKDNSAEALEGTFVKEFSNEATDAFCRHIARSEAEWHRLPEVKPCAKNGHMVYDGGVYGGR